jgi:hypothetical protein
MNDPTEDFRRSEVARINTAVESSDEDAERVRLEAKHGQVWDTKELQQDFEVHSFGAPYIDVTRKEDNTKGSLEFQHAPRFYYGFRSHP